MAITETLALGFALGAALCDLRCERVDNRQIVFGYLTGFLVHLGKRGAGGILPFLAGAVLPILLLWGLFLFRMLGAGDIKALSVLSGLLGASRGLRCLAWSVAAGAVLSLVLLAAERNWQERFLYFFQYVRRVLASGRRVAYLRPEDAAAKIHFTVPVLMGTMLTIGGFR